MATLSEDGKHYLLNGTKQFITNGGFATLFTVFAKIDRKHFTAFLVERDFPGVTIGPEEKKLGIKGSSTTPIILENAKVPVENLLGEIGKGHKIAFNVLNVGRFKLGAAVLGAAKYALGIGAAYANERKQFGLAISSFGAIQEKMADGVADLFASESLVYRLAGLHRRPAGHHRQGRSTLLRVLPGGHRGVLHRVRHLQGLLQRGAGRRGGRGGADPRRLRLRQEYPAERYYRDERINRIFEGTNEINRLLIPGMILRRAMKGEIPLEREAMKAFESLLSPSLDEIDPSVPFAAEKATIANLKKVFLVISGAAVKRFGAGLKDEQEVLLAAADVAIQAFAVESTVLRAERIAPKVSERRRALVAAAAKVHTFRGVEKLATAAKRAAFYVAEGDELAMLLAGVRRFTKYDASGLLAAKRLLAAAVIDAERYPL